MPDNRPLSSAEPEPVIKPSKLDKIKANLFMAGVITIPVALTGASLYVTSKMLKMQLDTAKLNLETAKLNKLP